VDRQTLFGLDADWNAERIGVLGNFLTVENLAMSTRERWIVYPLLFMTLGIALREKIVPPNRLHVSQVVCDRLQSTQSECRTLLVVGPNNRPVVIAGTDGATLAGTIETFSARGLPQVRLLSTATGGAITAIARGGKLALIMADIGQNFGVFAELPDLAQLIPLTLPWRLEGNQAGPRLPKGPVVPGRTPEKPATPKPAEVKPTGQG
jgi:hypothetical protein